jgi:hypothetical protein
MMDDHGPLGVIPAIEQVARDLDQARATLAGLPRPSWTQKMAQMPWNHTEIERMETLALAEAKVLALEHKLAQYQRRTLQHVIDLVSSIPQERDNFYFVREAERYLHALAKIQESLV